MKALLLIDLQNDFMPGGALAVPDGLSAVEAANIAQKYFNTVIATKDWHPANHLSFASNHKQKQAGEKIIVDALEQTLWPVHCVQHTQGAALVKSLDQKNIQYIVTKGENPGFDSYSAFFDNAHRYETGLKSYLESIDVDEIYLLGVATEYCIKYSALDAIYLGFKTYVITDGCRGIGLHDTDIPKAWEEMKQKGAHLITLKELSEL